MFSTSEGKLYLKANGKIEELFQISSLIDTHDIRGKSPEQYALAY